ncbi:mRNA 3'-end-processing protein YTH1 [Entamoeba marina]
MNSDKILSHTAPPPKDPKTIKKNEKTVVCQHWLRGMCRKGENCDFLHKYDKARMPICNHFLKYKKCDKPDCPFRHDLSSSKQCDWYVRGFCKHGKKCHHEHPTKLLCPLYYLGFCPYGPSCPFVHPTISLPNPTENERREPGRYGRRDN